MNRLPEAWIAPPATRELRELVRYRAKLVALRWCGMRVVAAQSGLPVRGVAAALIDPAYRTPHGLMPATAGAKG